ncbi:hypothetical protein D9M71_658180 [compost metagenome]
MLQIVTVFNGENLALYVLAALYVDFDLGCDRALTVMRGLKPHIGLVITALDLKGSNLDLLDQAPVIGINGIETINHVVLVRMGCRVAQRAKWVHGV